MPAIRGFGSTLSSGWRIGGSSMLFCGRKLSSFCAMRTAWESSSATKWTTPERICASAPPSSSDVTSSPVTDLMTLGPVMNMWALRVWMMKSVSAGE